MEKKVYDNTGQSIIFYNKRSDTLQEKIEAVLKSIGITEYGSRKSKYYEEHYYHKVGEEWEIFLDIALPPNIYVVKYGDEPHTDVSAYILLRNFGKNRVCNILYNKLTLIRAANGDVLTNGSRDKKTCLNQKP